VPALDLITPDEGEVPPEDGRVRPCEAEDADAACNEWAQGLHGPCVRGWCDRGTNFCRYSTESADGQSCDDGDPCTEGETCQTGACGNGRVRDCSDGLECTLDSCDAQAGCVHQPRSDFCDDAIACTVDRCDLQRGCVHDPDDRACDDGIPCNGVEVCDPAQGCVVTPVPEVDASCNGVDDDCNGETDEDYVPVTACGVGACAATATPSTCIGGVETPCRPGEPAANDATCNGIDDDCNGETDEDYVPVTTCGEGACVATATPSTCLGGVETPCQPGVPAANDATCNGVDDDCNGETDEDYVPVTTCGEGACVATAAPSTCIGGVETPCQPGEPAANDATCNGVDDDCNGETDEDYVPVTTCGEGACGVGSVPSRCEGGIETPCQPGVPAANDASCDGVDDDCNGETDEDYVPVTVCGEGACGVGSVPSRCEGGIETPCQPGVPAANDASCDGVDDDCNGETDEDYVPVTTCGEGACGVGSVPSRCEGGVETPCQPGVPAANDASCDGVDDDCNGETDEDYVPVTVCGLGACAQAAEPSRCEGGIETPCQPGTPAADDATCDGIDDDCDGQTDEDRDPPCGVPEDAVVGAEVRFDTTLGLMTGLVRDLGDGTYEDDLAETTNPNLAGAVQAAAQGNPSPQAPFQVVPTQTATVRLVTSRDVVFQDDSRVRVTAQVTDLIGSPVGADRTVTFALAGLGGASAVGTPVGPGIYAAWITVPNGAFGLGGVGTITATCDGVTSAGVPVEARAAPSSLVLDPGETGIELPLGPRFDGSQFDVPVYVNSGPNTIGSYDMAITFDPAVVQVVRVDQGSATDLAPPVSNAGTTANLLGRLSFNSINANPSGNNARGARVQVAIVRFQVVSGASEGAASSLSGEVLGLYNTVGAGVSILTNPVMWVRSGTGIGTSGVVTAKNNRLRGAFARVLDNTLLHRSALGGPVGTTTVQVHGAWADGGLSDVGGLPGLTCTVRNGAVAMTAGCQVRSISPGFTELEASVAGVTATTHLWVLAPRLPLDVRLGDAVLGFLPALGRLQDTRVQVRATFDDGSDPAFLWDVTDQVHFASEDSLVVAVDPVTGAVTAVGPGTTRVLVLGAEDAVLGTAEVAVDPGTQVEVSRVHVVVPARVQVTTIDPSPIPDGTGGARVQARVSNRFTAEGQTAQAGAWLVLSDDQETAGGSRIPITGDPATTWASQDPLVGTTDGGGVVTAVGGGATMLEATYALPGGDTVSGTGPFSVELPLPERVEATVTDPRLALSEADVSATLLGLPVTRQIQVRVFFVDGTSRDFTADPRTVYDAITDDPQDLVTVDDVPTCAGGDPGCVPGLARSTGNGHGRMTVRISFPGTYLESVSTSLDLEVVTHQSIVVESWELFTPAATARVAERVLSFIEGTGVRQRSRLEVLNTFTDGSVLDVTLHPATTFMVYDRGTTNPRPGVLSIGAGALVTAIAEGAVDVVATNSGHDTAPLPMAVDSALEDVEYLNLSYPPGATFQGVRDLGTGAMSVWGRFADGTRNRFTGADLVPGLLSFATAAVAPFPEPYLTIDGTGLATIRGNGPTDVLVDVDPARDTGNPFDPSTVLRLAANLLPAVGDVDLGQPTGLPFPDRSANEYFDMPVRANTGSSALGGIDLEVTYDPAVLEATGVRVGSGIPGALFAGNVSQPGTVFLNATPSVTGAPVIGSGVEVAVVTFRALKGGPPPVFSAMGGTIRGFVDRNGLPIGGAVPRPFVAGAGLLDPDSDGLFGDANDDGEFSIADVLFIQQITVVPPLVVPNPTQAAQSDIFPDGTVAVTDAFFGSQCLARLSHFVEATVTPDPLQPGRMRIQNTVVDRDQQPVSSGVRVRYEVSLVQNRPTVTFTNPHVATANGVLTEAVPVGAGVFETWMGGLLIPESGMGLVVILDVLDVNGNVVNSTAFLETPVLDPQARFVPLVTFDFDGCLAVDTTCDGIDDDCDGQTDDDYVPVALCGVGVCATNVTPSSCTNGVETPCEPGPPLGSTDETCDGVDDDCDGQADDDYVPVTVCGVGVCAATATPSSCDGGTETPCQPGTPAATDGDCDGQDDDCDGVVDQQACRDGLACTPDGDPCDDGNPLTESDRCQAGTCQGRIADCSPFIPMDQAVAVSDVALGQSGFPGQGLDIDGDPATCAPLESGLGVSPWCSDGIDNGLSVVEALVNPFAEDFLAGFTQGSVLASFHFARFDGEPFLLPLALGEVTPPGACDPKEGGCDYTLARWNFDDLCQPRYAFDNARILGDHLTAGGPGHDFRMETRYGVPITVFGAQVDARLVFRGGRITAVASASLAGAAVRPDEAWALLDAARPGPDDQVLLPPYPYTKGFVRDLLWNVLVPDVDTDGDGAADAVSFGLLFQALGAGVNGVGTPCTRDEECDDGNPCTADLCLPEAGCSHPFQQVACDDGDPTTIGDLCIDGVCQGRFRDCSAEITVGPMVALANPTIGRSGFPGQGLDIDGDPTTCAPEESGLGESPWCSDGIDNALAVVEGIANPMVAQWWAMPWGTFLADFREARFDGEPFPVFLYLGNVKGGSSCDFHTDTCVFDLPYWNFDAECRPMFQVTARIEGDRIRVGGPGTDWHVRTDFGASSQEYVLYDIQADGRVVVQQGRVVGVRQGTILGGAIRVADALKTLDEAFPGGDDVEVLPGYTKGFVRNVFTNVLQPDIDTNGDGRPDAVSLGVLIGATTAQGGDYRVACASAADCDDGNPCTADGCTIGTGCYHNWVTTVCDDGDPLTEGDRCMEGRCIGTIADCNPFLHVGDLVAVNGFSVGQSGFPGDGLDLDGDPTTCAPAESGLGVSPWCSDGIDNEVAVVEALANDLASRLLQDFHWGTFLLDFGRHDGTENPFDLPVYAGSVRWQDGDCDFQSESCTFDLPYWNFTPSCDPDAVLPRARIVGDRLTAGGPGTTYRIRTWINGPVSFLIHDLQLDGRVVRRGGRIAGLTGDSLFGGAIRLSDALLLLDMGAPGPDSVEVYQGLTKGFIRDVLTTVLQPDVDVNGDGVPEAVSFGARFSALSASVGEVRARCVADADCDDGNPCTYDGCYRDTGCFHTYLQGFCDDGDPLTLLDVCEQGVCRGRIPDCSSRVTFGDLVAANDVSVGISGFPGQGLDLDGRPETCAPDQSGLGQTPWCSDGIDNAVAVVEGIVNPVLADVLAGVRDSTILADFRYLRTDGEPFLLPLYIGIRDRNTDCDFHRDNCTFGIPWWNFDGQCSPEWGFANARVVGDRLTAGGPGYDMPLATIFQGEPIRAVLHDVQMDARLSFREGRVVGIRVGSLVGGALRQADGLMLLDRVFPGPETVEVQPGITKGFVRNLMTHVVLPDMDTDGDGIPESWSLGLRVSALEAFPGGVMARCGTGLPSCDDGNPCTEDLCDFEEGCRHRLWHIACDDGLPWTVGDHCEAGVCSGVVPDCMGLPVIADAARLDTLVPGIAGIPGEGLDVDGDPATCAPTVLQGASIPCSDGIDNALSLVEPLISPLLTESFLGFDNLTVLGDYSAMVEGGLRFSLPMYHGVRVDPACDPDVQTCSWRVPRYSLDAQCGPLYVLEDARLQDGVLTAGSVSGRIRVFGERDGQTWSLVVHAPRFRAVMPPGPAGAFEGIFAGAVRLSDLESVLDVLYPGPDSVPVEGGYTKGYVKDVLRHVLVADIDTDGDGMPDALSFGTRFGTTDAIVP